jgi:hypothetical protein
MYGAEIKVGRDFALRDKPTESAVRVRVLGQAPRGGRRVEHLTGDLQGLQEWRPSKVLLCPWGDLKSVMRRSLRSRVPDALIELIP